MNKTIFFILGFTTTILGMALILRFWQSAVIVFQGIVPTALALLGLVLMFAAGLKR